MTIDEYNKREKELLEAYRVGDIMEESELDEELEALLEQYKQEEEWGRPT